MAAELSPFAKEVAETLRYSDADIRKVLAGELVIHQLNDETKKELALTAAVEVPRSAQVIFADMQSRDFFEVDRTIHAWGSIEKFPVTAESLAKLVMPDAELDALLGVRPGSDFNLSEAEIVSLQATAKLAKGKTKVERRNGIMQTYRELLAARVNAFRALLSRWACERSKSYLSRKAKFPQRVNSVRSNIRLNRKRLGQFWLKRAVRRTCPNLAGGTFPQI